MKNGRYFIGLIILLLAIIGAAFVACDGSSPLVGNWEHTEDEGYIEFFSDGKAEIRHESYVYTWTYEETGDNEITLTLVSMNGEEAGEDESIVLSYSFSGDELTLTDGESPETFTKVE